LTVEASPYSVSRQKLRDAYIAGLQGWALDVKLDSLKPIFSLSQESSLRLRQKVVDKRFPNGGWAQGGEVRDLDTAPSAHRRLFLSVQSELESALTEQAGGRAIRILARGHRVKTTGGSAGLPRFWYAVEDAGQVRLIEFKAEVEPAPAGRALTAGERSEMVLGLMSRLREPVQRWFTWVRAAGYEFNLREKVEDVLDVDPADAKPNDINDQERRSKEARELALWIAHDLGRVQRQEKAGASLLALLKRSQGEEQLESLISQVEKALRSDSVRNP
jgi:hypothetical protein